MHGLAGKSLRLVSFACGFGPWWHFSAAFARVHWITVLQGGCLGKRLHILLIPAITLTLLLLISCSSPEGESEGYRLIDKLISCDPPGTWDREGMLLALEEREEEYTAFLKQSLEDCYLLQTISLSPTPAPTSTPAPLTSSAVALLHHYHMLLSFKNNADFHAYCYGAGGPYHVWVESGEALPIDLNTWQQTGVYFNDLWRMGWDYCQNQGQETEETRYIKSQMNPRWLAELPPIPPSPTPTTDELAVKICTDFLSILTTVEGMGLTPDQQVGYLLEDGFTLQELQALSDDCPGIVSGQ